MYGKPWDTAPACKENYWKEPSDVRFNVSKYRFEQIALVDVAIYRMDFVL